MARLIQSAPVRAIGISRGALTGRLQLAGTGHTAFESSLERDWLSALDFREDVWAIVEQPFTVTYSDCGTKRSYTPDVMAEFRPKDEPPFTVVYEVKPASELRENWELYKPRFLAARAYCRKRGWRFKLVTEKHIRNSFLKNARFLRQYLRISDVQTTKWQLLYTLRGLGCTTPQALLAAAYWDEESRMTAIPMLWKLVGERLIATDLNAPLTMTSVIREAP